VPAAGRHREVSSRSDRIRSRRALERGTHVEPRQFFETHASACVFRNFANTMGLVPQTRVVLYREQDGSCPFLDHRILYFFHGAIAAVISHGLVKERAVPPNEINRAVERKKRFVASPQRHTYEEV